MTLSLPDDLIDAVYRTVLEPAAWGDVMALMKRSFPSEAQTFYFLHRAARRVQPVCLTGVGADWVRSFSELYFLPDNPWMRLTQQLHQTGVVRTNERLDRILREPGALYRSEYYNEWMRPQGFRYSIGTTLLAEPDLVANITLLRAPDMRSFDGSEVRAFERLARHMTRALQLTSRLERPQTNPAMASVFDAMPQAIALVDARRRMVYANAAMESLLRSDQGLSLAGGELNAAQTHARQVFAAWFARAGAAVDSVDPCGPLQVPCGTQGHLTVHAIPLAAPSNGSLPRLGTVLLLALPAAANRTPVSAWGISQRYGCTMSESRLAYQLAQGDSLREAARKMGITYGTARDYLKMVFGKLGVHSQAQLVARLLGDLPTPLH